MTSEKPPVSGYQPPKMRAREDAQPEDELVAAARHLVELMTHQVDDGPTSAAWNRLRIALRSAAPTPAPTAGQAGGEKAGVLEDCPFCAGKVEAQSFGPSGPFYAHCGGCGMTSPNADTMDELVAAWNRRAHLGAGGDKDLGDQALRLAQDPSR